MKWSDDAGFFSRIVTQDKICDIEMIFPESWKKLAGGFGVLALIACHLASPAMAQTEQAALNRPAINVKAPTHAFLEGVAQAGGRLVAVGEHGVIIYSDDEGKSWHQAAVPVDVLLTSVSFSSAKEGWAAGHYGVVLKTEDGGATWSKSLDGDQVNELALQAAKNLSPQQKTLPAAPLAMRRATLFKAVGPDKPFLSILALGPGEAIAVGAYRMADVTRDGGKDWQDLSLEVGDPLSHNLYDIADANGALYIAGETGLVFRSADQGASFPEVTAPGSTTLFGILGTADGGLFAYGVAGVAYISHDDGQSWQSINVGTQASLTAGLLLKSGAILAASEAGVLYISHDNGLSFTQVLQTPMAVTGLAQTKDGNVAVVGSGGVMVLPASDFANAH